MLKNTNKITGFGKKNENYCLKNFELFILFTVGSNSKKFTNYLNHIFWADDNEFQFYSKSLYLAIFCVSLYLF